MGASVFAKDVNRHGNIGLWMDCRVNTGYDIVGLIIEAVESEILSRVIAKHITLRTLVLREDRVGRASAKASWQTDPTIVPSWRVPVSAIVVSAEIYSIAGVRC